MHAPLAPETLLEPDRLDGLPLIGVGTAARVFRHGRFAVKVAHPTSAARARLLEELDYLQRLQAGPMPCPRLFAVRADRAALVRGFVAGTSLLELLRARRGELEQALFERLWALHLINERLREQQGLALDFSPANLFVAPRGGALRLADLGRRLDPPLFAGLDRAQLRRGLVDYLDFRDRLERPDRVELFLLPPSGRHGVEVAVGRAAGARLLWINHGLRARLGLSWSRAKLEALGGLATHAPAPSTERLASRYQDSRGTGEGEAQGDGRVIYVGTIGGGRYGRRELTLKGCGPTPLAWHGHEFHFDGFVSFSRTLWESAICDELGRLGFETPEVLAICATGKTTIDNTLVEWPAATALRVADTHLRVGHLHRWADDAGALKGICLQAGRTVLRPDFDPGRPGHLGALLINFAHNLGHDAGRSEALNVHCFNPTMGNLRVDGHFIDFSTVRFQRYHLPTYTYLDGKRAMKHHRSALRQQARRFVELFGRAGLLSEAQVGRLRARVIKRYDDRYVDGYLDGLGRLLGYAALKLSASARRCLVSECVHLRYQRAAAELDFPQWKQRHPAPLFDLEGRAPDFVRAWRRGERRPWLALRSEFEGALSPFADHVGRAFFEALARAIPPSQLRGLRPRRLDQVVRPFMFNRRLAALCYQRSTPEDFAEWRRQMASSRHLPEGRYRYLEARESARALGHLELPTLSGGAEVVVGLTEELYEALCELLDEVLGERLVGALAFGSRVMTRARLRQLRGSSAGIPSGGAWLRERGLEHARCSDLNLLLLVDDTLDEGARAEREGALRERFERMSALFPIGSRRRGAPWLLPTTRRDLRAAASALEHAPWAGPEQAALLYDREEGRPLPR